MKKAFKYLFIIIFLLPFLPVAILVFWIYSTFKIIKYLWNEKNKYNNIRDCFKISKNIGALFLSIVCLVVVPIVLVNFTNDFIESEKVRQDQEIILQQEEEKNLEQKKYDSERNKVLDPNYRIKKEIDKVKSVDDTCILTQEDIQKHNITAEEIAKFEKDRELAITEYKDNKIIKNFEKIAEKYVSDNTTSTINKFYSSSNSKEYGFNDDKTIVTISGHYKGRNPHLVYVKGYYTIKLDAESGEIIDSILEKEFIDNAKHPKE